jgi:predicted dehydrogenase
MLNAAIIGFGDIGYYLSKDKKRKQTWSHFEAYKLINETELKAIVEKSQKKIDFIKKKYPQILVFQNIEKLINSNLKIDIISICTPTKTHFKILNKSLRLKPKIIICEKPLCKSINEAKKIISIYKKKNIKVVVNHQRRFETNFLIAKKIIEEKKIGKIININGIYTSKIINIGTHLIDCIRMITKSEPKYTYSVFKKRYDKKDPSITGILYFNNDITCSIQAMGNKYKYVFEIDIIGSKGRVRIINNGKKIEYFKFNKSKNFMKYEELFKKTINTNGQNDPMRELFKNAITAYKKNKNAYPDLNDGFQNLLTVDTMIKSATQKKLLKI